MIQTAVLGYGIVGSGVVHVLDKNHDVIKHNAGQVINVKYILDIRGFPESPYKHLFVNDFDVILSDPEISIVVEVIGGVGAALDYTKRCLEAGKNVVTSNKELVSEHGNELFKLAEKMNVNYLFEASVGGGIPVIRPLTQCMTANAITEIYGILNGTTNYILTDMQRNGADFTDALSEAQKKGYAEADPTSDIEGYDTCRKICILSSLAFGIHILPGPISVEGICGVTIDDMRYADDLGYKIKLLGRARTVGNKISVYVAPHLINIDNLPATIDDVMNCVVFRGNVVGNVMLCGPGAGKLPTASAIVADMIDIVKRSCTVELNGYDIINPDTMLDSALLESAWYIRTDVSREKVEKEFGTVIFANTGNNAATKNKETVFITAVMSGKKITELLNRGITAKSQFRVLGDH